MSAASQGGPEGERVTGGVRGVLAAMQGRSDRFVSMGALRRSEPQEGMHAETTDVCSALLVRISSGDAEAFNELFDRHYQPLMMVLLRFHGEKKAAEVALRELFTMIWIHAGMFDPRRCSGTRWIYGLARGDVRVRF